MAGIRGGEKVRVSSARSQYVAKALVTRRIKPMMIDGKKTYQIGVPIHWGYRGIAEEAGKTSLDPRAQGCNLLIREGATLSVGGLMLGVGGAYALGRAMESTLFGTGAMNVPVLLAVSVALLTYRGEATVALNIDPAAATAAGSTTPLAGNE